MIHRIIFKYRVERERTDNGFGLGWVVLDPTGNVVGNPRTTWRRAYSAALMYARVGLL